MLSRKHRAFVEEYVRDVDAVAAYRRAGYKASAGCAAVNAARLLRNPEISAAIAEKQAALAKEIKVSAQDVLRELSAAAFSDIGRILDFSATEPGAPLRLLAPAAIPEEARRSIQSMKVRRYIEGTGDAAREVEVTEFRLWPKIAALVELGKHLGLFRPPPETAVTVNVENKVKVDARTLFAEVEEYLPVFQRIAEEKILANLAALRPPEEGE